MCDYSMMHAKSRKAEVNDELVVRSFGTTKGFIEKGTKAIEDTAVCMIPGTEVAFEKPPRYWNAFDFYSTEIESTTARFRQIDLEFPYLHHDALEFADGTLVLVTLLEEGTRARVLQLPADPEAKRVEHQELTQATTQQSVPENVE